MAQTAGVSKAASNEETARTIREKLGRFVPEEELPKKAELVARINQLKHERNAVILGHNYMTPEVFHTVPDYTGDSLELSRISGQTEADVIVFCGVLFMAETAKILNPNKTVLIPLKDAGCSLAESIEAEDVRALKAQYPGAPVVTYVNTYAAVKAESDYCCTSGNAKAVVQHLLEEGHNKIIFLPDEFLARNVARELGVPVHIEGGEVRVGDVKPEQARRVLIGWPGRCVVHEVFTTDDVRATRETHPNAVILAHPECPPEVIEQIDIPGSTKRMADYVRDVEAPGYVLFTESSMAENLAASYPDRNLIPFEGHLCDEMKKITLENTVACLENMDYKVELPDDAIDRARQPIERMLAIQ